MFQQGNTQNAKYFYIKLRQISWKMQPQSPTVVAKPQVEISLNNIKAEFHKNSSHICRYKIHLLYIDFSMFSVRFLN